MTLFKAPGEYVLISVGEAEPRTGRPAEELLDETGVQTLVRISANGEREEMLRIPRRLLLDHVPSDEKPNRPRRVAAADA
jgi:hypothetical protein